MSLSEGAWRLGLTARLGVVEFITSNPTWVLLTAVVPRGIFQCLFFTMLGQVIGGSDGRAYAFVGSLAGILTLAGTIAVIDVPMVDKWYGTFYRLRTGRVSPFLVFLLRALPYPVLGMVLTLTALVVVGPLTGQLALTGDLVPWLPVYVLMSLTTTAVGLTGAALAVGRRATVLVGNLLAYLMLLTCGVFLPPGQLAWVDYLGRLLPIRHGLEAVRAGQAGESWLPALGAEVAVGAGWLLVAWVVVTVQVRRARRHGFDHFT